MKRIRTRIPSPTIYGLDVGCGDDKKPGYDGIDIRDCKQKYQGDARFILPTIPDHLYERIDFWHFLEHFHWEDIKAMLLQAHRILEKDGIMHIQVPDGKDATQWRPYHYALYSLSSFDFLAGDEDFQDRFRLVQKYQGKYGHLNFVFKAL